MVIRCQSWLNWWTCDFWRRLEPCQRINIICQMFLFLETKVCCNYVFQLSLLPIRKKEKDECNFNTRIVCCYKFLMSLGFGKALFCRWKYLTAKAVLYMFNWVLNTRLVLTIKQLQSFIIGKLWFTHKLWRYFALLIESRFSNLLCH